MHVEKIWTNNNYFRLHYQVKMEKLKKVVYVKILMKD